jgi:NhaC family Na+:H+ antiporter
VVDVKQPSISLGWALVPVVILIGLLAGDVWAFADDSSYGPNQIAMLITALIAGGIGMWRVGTTWQAIRDAIAQNISTTSEALLILLLIGALSGTWLVAGIIPAFIHYGLQLLDPSWFLAAACVICAVLSLATGSSWGTVGTVGVALIGIGTALGISTGWVAGAIISGAYFGDKLSPLSDTTNIAPAVAGTDLFTHIRYMLYTTLPSISIALIVFLVAGLGGGQFSGALDTNISEEVGAAIQGAFDIHLGLFIAPVAVIFMIAKKVPAAPALFIGVLLGGLTAWIWQPAQLAAVAGSDVLDGKSLYTGLFQVMAGDSAIVTGNGLADELLSSGGMAGMLNTVWLILCAMTFGATMQATGMLDAISRAMLKGVTGTLGLVARASGTCLAFNILTADQYLAIVIPGNMYKDSFEAQGLAPENLSRTLEDTGTVTSVLIPWNTCGVAQAGILGVSTWTYLPYCIFNWISPLTTLVVAALGWNIRKLPKAGETSGAS